MSRCVASVAFVVALSGCGIVNEILGTEPCDGNPKTARDTIFSTPNPLSSGGTDFYTGIEGDRRILRFSTSYTNVCSEEHLSVFYRFAVNPLEIEESAMATVTAQGDVTPYLLFEESINLPYFPPDVAYQGTLGDFGLAQWYEGEPGEFLAGIQISLPASMPEDQVIRAAPAALIRATFRDAPAP